MSEISKDINIVKRVLFAEDKIDAPKVYTYDQLMSSVWRPGPYSLFSKVDREISRRRDGELVEIYYNEGLKTGYGEVVWSHPYDDRMLSKSALYKFTVDDKGEVHVSSRAASTIGEHMNVGRTPVRFLVTESSIKYKDEIQ